MTRLPNVVIVLARCSHSEQLFGLRLEETSPSMWAYTWAFQISERKAGREGYTQNQINGNFFFAADYPGCPYCENGSSLIICSCSKASCYDGESMQIKCPWCKSIGQVSGIATRLTAGNDLI